MPAETSFAKIKYALAADETKAFPAEVSEPGAKTIDTFLEEKTLHFKNYLASGTLKSGELAVQESNAKTFTLPLAATENQLIGVFSLVNETKVTTSGGATISGDFVSAETTIILTKNQHVVLQSVGGKWIIIAGEPKKEQTYTVKAFTKAEAEAEVEPSASRPALVLFNAGKVEGLKVGGVSIPLGSETKTVTVIVPPGQKWRLTVAAEVSTLLQ